MSKVSTLDEYVTSQVQWKKDVLITLRNIVKKNVLNAEEAIKWAQPVFSGDTSSFCFICAHKNHINIRFWRGAMMKDAYGLLESEAKKICHVKIAKSSDIYCKAIGVIVKQPLRLNQQLGNPTR
jgi:hypothetical protein